MNILVIDIGGTNVKILATGQSKRVKITSGTHMTPEKMVSEVKAAAAEWPYEAISIGYPGPVKNNQPQSDPKNLAPGWVGFDFAQAFGCPIKMINDAAMQALGSYEGGTMLFLGLGTGLGTCMIIDGTIAALELAHLPYKNGNSYEHYVGAPGMERSGKKRWRKHVAEVLGLLRYATQAEYIVLGGGNASLLKELPDNTILGSNKNAFTGGYRLWEESP